MDMNLLPDKLWTEIFSKMTAKERNPFRIACRRMMNCCNCLQIQKMEKFHLPGVSNLEDMVKILSTIDRPIMNLKISTHRLESLDSIICSQVEQLELENCIVTKFCMQEILACCEKLTHLTLRNVNILYSIGDTPLNTSDRFGEFFIQLNELDIVASSVETLAIECTKSLELNEIKSMVSVFPNVVNFEINFSHSQVLVPRGQVFDVAVCESLVKHMATKLLQLETLVMKFQKPGCDCEKHIQKVKFPRLKTFKFYDINEIAGLPIETEIYIPRVYSFITSSHSQHFTSVEFFYNTKTEDIIDMLKKQTSLRVVNMKLTSMRDFFEFIEFYKTLANSKLVSITIHNKLKSDWFGFLPQILDDTSLPVNSTVRELTISNNHEEDIFMSIFLKCFSALNRLSVLIVDKNSYFTNIFYQAKLKCVELKSNLKWSLGNDGNELPTLTIPTSDRIFVENLEYLHISTDILKELSVRQPSIFFSNLRYLHLSSSGFQPMFSEQLPLTQEELRCLSLHNLERVYMQVDSCINDIFTFFSNPSKFPKIQYIAIKIPNKHLIFHYQHWFQPWFQLCPCLKTIFLAHVDYGICVCYDPIKGKIRLFDPAIEAQSNPREHLNDILMFRYHQNMASRGKFWLNTI